MRTAFESCTSERIYRCAFSLSYCARTCSGQARLELLSNALASVVRSVSHLSARFSRRLKRSRPARYNFPSLSLSFFFYQIRKWRKSCAVRKKLREEVTSLESSLIADRPLAKRSSWMIANRRRRRRRRMLFARTFLPSSVMRSTTPANPRGGNTRCRPWRRS